MLDSTGTIIYVGKAKNLKKRVSSYFNRTHTDIKTAALVSQIRHIEFIATQNEQEALVLENQLIKRLMPRYNIQLKDDKNYPYLKLTTNEPFPKLLITRSREADGAEYFGPFPFMGSIYRFRQTLLSLFPIRDCMQSIDLTHEQKKCIKLDMKTCVGPCVIKDVKPEYDHMIHQIRLLLRGKNRQLIGELRDEMMRLAAEQRFEKAAHIRDSIQKIEKIQQRQTVDIEYDGVVHVWAVAERDSIVYALVQEIIDGKLLAQKGFYADRDGQSTDEFLVQSCVTYLETGTPPDEIWCESPFQGVFQSTTVGMAGKLVNVVVPVIGAKRTLLDTANLNARLAVSRIQRSAPLPLQPETVAVLESLQQQCQLRRCPHRIIGFDISHLSATNIVASAVYFFEGKPLKSMYRKFNIRSVVGKSNDPLSMYEVVLRRLHRTLVDDEQLPDLVLIDGGKGQLNFAVSAMQSLPLPHPVDVVSLAKREELVFSPGLAEPIRLSLSDPALRLLQYVRDESHRFAVSFQRQKRAGWLTDSVLDQIPGLGPKRVTLLLSQYKSVERIRELTVEELAKVGNMGRTCAESVLNFLSHR